MNKKDNVISFICYMQQKIRQCMSRKKYNGENQMGFRMCGVQIMSIFSAPMKSEIECEDGLNRRAKIHALG